MKKGIHNKQSSNKEIKKENRLGLIILCFSILICIISISYAVWTQFLGGKKINQITTSKLEINFQNEENEILLENSLPISDEQGKLLEPYVFEVKNVGKVAVNYRLYLAEDLHSYKKDKCEKNKMSLSDIKYSFENLDNNSYNTNIISATNGMLDEGTLGVGEVKSFSLKLWIKSDAKSEIMGKHFHGKVKMEAIQSDQNFND